MARKLIKKNTKVQKVVKKIIPAKPNVVARQTPATAAGVNLPQGEYIETVGRRKTATARVRLYKSPGDLLVNRQAAGAYFHGVFQASARYLQPFKLTDTQKQFAVSAIVSGSGLEAQLDAMVHGISRALVELNEAHRLPLKQAGLLTRDDRMKETRKIGMGGKARRRRQSPKR